MVRAAVGLLTAAASSWSRPSRRRPRRATPTPPSLRPGTPAAAPPVRSGPRTAASTPSVTGFGQNFAGGKIFFTPATGAHIMQGAILDKYESLGGPADERPGFPHHRRGSRADRPGQPQHHVQRRRQAGDLLDPGPPAPGWCVAPSTPPGTSSAARRDRSVCRSRTRPTAAKSSRRNSPAESCRGTAQTKTFTTMPPELAGQLDGLEVPDDPTSAINAARRAAGGPLGPLGAEKGAPYDRRRRPRSELRRRQDLLQPVHRGARRHRPGPGEVRERRRARG